MDDFTVNLDRWLREFPVETLSRVPYGSIVSSPFNLAVNEHLRREVASLTDLGRAVPTDIFVFGDGEPSRRDVTKVGGLPYRPEHSPWPRSYDGRRLPFLAQLRFEESRDIVRSIPSSMLLIFCTDPDEPPDSQEDFYFEWQPFGIVGLASKIEAEESDCSVHPCYGVRHRTADFPEGTSAFRNVGGDYLLSVWEGTKIGGIPRWIQDPEPIDGHFLAALGSIEPVTRERYPWVNQEEPISFEEFGEKFHNLLNWGDSGSLYMFLQEDCTIRWAIQSY